MLPQTTPKGALVMTARSVWLASFPQHPIPANQADQLPRLVAQTPRSRRLNLTAFPRIPGPCGSRSRAKAAGNKICPDSVADRTSSCTHDPSSLTRSSAARTRPAAPTALISCNDPHADMKMALGIIRAIFPFPFRNGRNRASSSEYYTLSTEEASA
ncbi:hypothetical protein VDGL01_03329 [Verticillium dahliae]